MDNSKCQFVNGRLIARLAQFVIAAIAYLWLQVNAANAETDILDCSTMEGTERHFIIDTNLREIVELHLRSQTRDAPVAVDISAQWIRWTKDFQTGTTVTYSLDPSMMALDERIDLNNSVYFGEWIHFTCRRVDVAKAQH